MWRDQSLQTGQDEPEGYAGHQGTRAQCKRNRGKVFMTLNTTWSKSDIMLVLALNFLKEKDQPVFVAKLIVFFPGLCYLG